MSETNVSLRFSWEPASWGQSIKAFFRTPPPVQAWFTELEEFNMNSFGTQREKGSPRLSSDGSENKPLEESCTVLHKTIAYLAQYSNPRLEKILETKFGQISSSTGVKNIFHSILLLSLRTNRPKMLEVCQKVLSLNKLKALFHVSDVISLAQKEALVVQKPQHRVASISKSLIHALQQPLLKIRKVIQYIFSTTGQAYGVDFDAPPKNSQKAQGQWSFYRDTAHDICVIAPFVRAFFTVQVKTSIAIATLFAVFITAVYRLSELPARHAAQLRIEQRLPLHGSDDIQQCHTPGVSIKRDPSAELESFLQIIERQLTHLSDERESTIDACNIERQKNPNWVTSEKGKLLFGKLDRIDKDIEKHNKKITEIRRLSLRLEKISQIRFDDREKEHAVIHFLNENSKNPNNLFEESQKNYLNLKYLVLPELEREYMTIIAKCTVEIIPPTHSRSFGLRARAVSTSFLQASNAAPAALTRLTAQVPVQAPVLGQANPPDGQ